jgi:hypothetical protein
MNDSSCLVLKKDCKNLAEATVVSSFVHGKLSDERFHGACIYM